MLAHVYLFTRGIALSNLLTFWLPLELAAFLILIAAIYSDDNWVFGLIIILAAALHLVLAAATVPEFQASTDAIYGYQLVNLTLNTGQWTFGAGTGQSHLYSYFPLMFIFTALWSGIGSIPPILLVNYGFVLVNLASFLSLRMLSVDLLNFSKRQANLVLFLYSLTPTIHRVEAKFHYEAYSIIFFALVFLFVLKPKISASERIVAVISILAIALSHYFTAYILLLNAIVILVAYLVLKGARVHTELLFMAIVVPIALISSVAVAQFGHQILVVQSILSHIKDVGTLFSKLATPTDTVATYYPARWFADLATVRNGVILLLGLMAIFTFCVSISRRLGIRFKTRGALTYLAAAWLFSVFFSLAAYYGVAWNDTILATQGPGSARNRIAEFAFIQFAVFSGLGLSILLKKFDNFFHGKKFGSGMSGSLKVALAVCLIVIFASSAVVQAYPRIAYDSGYKPIFFDEYRATFQEPYYLATWWYGVANHTITNSNPWTGSRSLKDFVRGYGWQPWWEDTLNQTGVNINETTSRYHTVYYAVDTLQVQKPDHLYRQTLNPDYVSSHDTQLNTIFNTGRIMVAYKPTGV